MTFATQHVAALRPKFFNYFIEVSPSFVRGGVRADSAAGGVEQVRRGPGCHRHG